MRYFEFFKVILGIIFFHNFCCILASSDFYTSIIILTRKCDEICQNHKFISFIMSIINVNPWDISVFRNQAIGLISFQMLKLNTLRRIDAGLNWTQIYWEFRWALFGSFINLSWHKLIRFQWKSKKETFHTLQHIQIVIGGS